MHPEYPFPPHWAHLAAVQPVEPPVVVGAEDVDFDALAEVVSVVV